MSRCPVTFGRHRCDLSAGHDGAHVVDIQPPLENVSVTIDGRNVAITPGTWTTTNSIAPIADAETDA